jgi:hypothetical protein
MIERNIEVDKINYWYCFTQTEENVVYDGVFINYTKGRLPLYFKFQRYKNFCYHDSIKDFVIKYVSNIQYTTLVTWLNKNASNLRVLDEQSNINTKTVGIITTNT